jgi:molybdopterin-containing oxidoreductase family membrane subunit
MYERYTYLAARPFGPYSVIFWTMIAANVLTPQLFWFRRLRTSAPVLFGASLAILAGMWTERFIIIVTSLNRDFLPSSWHFYAPTWVDWSILLGTVSLFCLLFLLFIRFVPFVALHEMKRLRYDLDVQRLPKAGGPVAVTER